MASKVIATLFPSHYPVHLLHNTHISEIAIPKQIITVVTAGTHISAVLETFSRNNIVSAPILTDDGKIFGFVDMLDIVALFEHCKRRDLPIGQFFSAHVEKAVELPLSLEVPVLQGVPRHPCVTLPHTATMAELLQVMTRGSVHRIAMTTDGKVTAVITQRDVLRWIMRNIKAFEHESLIFNVNKTMAQLGFGSPSERPIEKVTEGTFTVDAFARMRNNDVSCLPVVNDSGSITHVLSASDLRSLSVSSIDLLEQPLRIFLNKRPASSLVTATADTKFSEVLRRLDDSGKHRAVLTDTGMKPIAMVSLSDIIPLFAVMSKQ